MRVFVLIWGWLAMSRLLWAIAHGLKLTWEMGFRKVVLETDSKTGLELIQNNPKVVRIITLSSKSRSGFRINGNVRYHTYRGEPVC